MNSKIIKMALFLAIISSVAGGALAFVNSITAPIIAEKSIAAERANLEIIFPNTASFQPLEVTNDDTGLIQAAYTAVGSGIAYRVSVMGYSNPIVFLVGISTDGEIIGFKVLELSDTVGIGTRVDSSEFDNAVLGKSTTDPIAPLSGATVSSAAVIRGINAARAHFNAQAGIEDDGSGSEVVIPDIQFGESIGFFNDQTLRVTGEILDLDSADVETYVVSIPGYSVLEGGYDGAENNIVKVVIDRSTNTIVAVELVEFNDTPGLGDKVDNDKFWDQFVGLDINDDSLSVDAVSGATSTSLSMVRAVVTAIINE